MEKFAFTHCHICKNSINPNRPIRFTINCMMNITEITESERERATLVFCYFCYNKNEAEILSLEGNAKDD